MERLTDTPEYRAWRNMLTRCANPRASNWKYYGGRGIKVCERWQDFLNFVLDMGRRPSSEHSIDRWPNQDGNYEPGNCRWATRDEQTRNKRRSQPPRNLAAQDGFADWAREYRQHNGRNPKVREAKDAFKSMSRTTVWRRLKSVGPRLLTTSTST
jgi:hypothetical protein